MAERRMFSKTIVESDAFIDMPLSTQALYFHYGMLADDEGFVNSPKKIQRMIGANEDDLKLLITKRFILPFESGIIVLKHWRINNYIQKDRFKETLYKQEKSQLSVKENGSYTECIQDVSKMYTQDRLGKVSIGKDSIECISASDEPEPTPKKAVKHKHGEYQKVLLTDTEVEKLIEEYGKETSVKLIKYLDEYIEMKGYKAKNHYLAIRKWVVDAVKEQEAKKGKTVNTGVPKGNQDDLDDFFN